MNVLVAIYSDVAAWNIPESHVERLRREFPRHTFVHAPTEADVLPRIAEADVAFASELRAAHFAAAPRLRWVHSPAAGVGGMLLPQVIDSPVEITNSRVMSADTIGEHVLMVALALFRKLPLFFRAQARGEWVQDEGMSPPALRMIRDAHVLVVGLGGIGSAAARQFAKLGAVVTGVRRAVDRPAPKGVSAIEPPERLLDLLPHADIVVLAAPQTRTTKGLIGRRELEAMRRDAILINVSRGKLVDEAALAQGLADGLIAGAALDVFEHEPLAPASPLWSQPNVIITPHVAGFRADHWDAATTLFANNLRRFDGGQPLVNVVDKHAGY
jgi:phosphoglycerate dehydrogenase-like enzyme